MVEGRKEANMLLIGDGAVGKTAITKVYHGDAFPDEAIATLGLDYFAIDVQPKSSPNKSYNLKIWDTAGQERFKSLTVSFYKQSQGMMVVYDVSRRKTFESVKRWLLAINTNCKEDVAVILVANKCDLEDDRVVSEEEGR